MKIEGERWDMYMHPFEDGTKAVISFDADVAEEPQHVGYRHGRRVILTLDPQHVRANGLPDAAETTRLRELEEKLIAMLEGVEAASRFVGRMTYNGQRELVFQTADGPEFAAVVEAWHERHGPFSMEVRETPGWSFFDEQIRPQPEHWLQIFDRRVIDELTAAGTDTRRLHMLEFTFRGSPLLLPGVARVLYQHNFAAQPFGPETLIVREPSLLYLDRIWELSKEFDRLARERGVKYEGWGAAVVPPPAIPVNEESIFYAADGAACVLVCPFCFSEVKQNATRCRKCERALDPDAAVDLTFDEFVDLKRVPCPSCHQLKAEPASVCAHCGKAVAQPVEAE